MLETSLRFLNYLGFRSDDDWVDRLHNFLTCNLLFALAILISWKQFGGKPIECMLPKMFPGSWEDYAENYCWAQDTFFLTLDVDVTRNLARDRKISYYQWVPFFLLIVACCFRVPSLIWKYMSGHSGIRIHELVRVAVDERNIQAEVKQSNLKSLTTHLQNALRFHRRLHRKQITPHKFLRMLNLPYTAVYVTFTYLLTKVLYLINVWAQLILMNKFLHTDKYAWYGWGAMQDLLQGVEWKTSGVFPRVTLCDFEVRGMGNLQNHTVQCVLVINIFNEKIFIFLWFWFMILMILTTASFVYWMVMMLLPWPSRWFVSRHLELSEMPFDPKGSAKDVERFVSSYLKTDGVFVLRMITMHSGIIFGTDLVLALWRSFYGIEEKIRLGGGDQASAYLTPTPTNENVSNSLRQRRLREDQKAIKGGKGDQKSSPKRDDDKNKSTSLVEAATKSKRNADVVLIPTAPSVAIKMPDSKSTTLEASKRPRRPAKDLRLKMPSGSSSEEDDNGSDQQGDVEKGVPLLPRRGRQTSPPSPKQRTSL